MITSWVKQSGETYPKNFISQRENQFFGGKKSLRAWVRTPAPTSKWQICAVAMFAEYRIRCYLSSRLSLKVFGENIKNPIQDTRSLKISKISKTFSKIFQFFDDLKWILLYERALKSDFLLTSLFFTQALWGSKHTKVSVFREKNSKFFRSPKMVRNGFCALKEHSEWFF